MSPSSSKFQKMSHHHHHHHHHCHHPCHNFKRRSTSLLLSPHHNNHNHHNHYNPNHHFHALGHRHHHFADQDRIAPSGRCRHLWEAPGWPSVAKGFDDNDYAAGVDDDCDVGQVGEEIVWDSCHLNVTRIIKNQSAMEKLRLKETSIPPQHQHQHQHHNGNLNQTCGAEEQGQLGAALSEAILSVSSPPR